MHLSVMDDNVLGEPQTSKVGCQLKFSLIIIQQELPFTAVPDKSTGVRSTPISFIIDSTSHLEGCRKRRTSLYAKNCTFLRKDRKSHTYYKEMCNIFHIDHP